MADVTLFDMVVPLTKKVGTYQLHIGKRKVKVKIVNMWDYKGGKKGTKKIWRVKQNGKRLLV